MRAWKGTKREREARRKHQLAYMKENGFKSSLEADLHFFKTLREQIAARRTNTPKKDER